MSVEFQPLSETLIPAARAFNARLRAHGPPPFVLPDSVAFTPESVSARHYVAVDSNGEVRGGMLLSEHQGWLQSKEVPLINIQSPLSEGLVDRRYSGIGLQILRFVADCSPYAYAVGMGDERKAWPRLLKAAGWSVRPIPFKFTVINARRFLRQIGLLRSGPQKWLARTAAASGVGSVLLLAWRSAHQSPRLRGYSLNLATAWPEASDSVWKVCRQDVSFSVLRDERTLVEMYPDAQPRLRRFILRSNGEVVGWSVGLITQMTNNDHFGDLVVGTIVDGVAEKKHLAALLALTRERLREMNAEVIVTNQTHREWLAALGQLGFINGPSNYLLALSKPLATALASDPCATELMHVNRGDGDGRMHL